MTAVAKNARSAMKAKAKRLSSGLSGKVDSSDWTPAEPLNADIKTGMRPLSRKAFKKGGKVVAVEGSDAKAHAGRKPRKSGGRAPITPNSLVNRNLKEANEEREGKKHVGGFKRGGRTKREDGGGVSEAAYKAMMAQQDPQQKQQAKKLQEYNSAISQNQASGSQNQASGLKKGGRAKKLGGGYIGDNPVSQDMRSQASAAQPFTQPKKSGGRAKKEGGGRMFGEGEAAQHAKAERKMYDGFKKTHASEKVYEKMVDRGEDPAVIALAREELHKNVANDLKTQAAETRARRETGYGLKKGGKVSKAEWEHSKKDLQQDKKLAKKHGMSMEKWEKSKLDEKHDKQQSAKGLKSGGKAGLYANIHAKRERIEEGSGEKMRKAGDEGAPTAKAFKESERTARKSGGRTKSKGKTNINIVIATGAPRHKEPRRPDDMMQGMGKIGLPPPSMDQQGAMPPVPPMPQGAPIPAPTAGPNVQPPMTLQRKAGGRTYRSYKDMDAGAGSGMGRLEKTEIQARKGHKVGGKVYRSYKDMDAGAGSGKGRLEKTEIQKNKSR